jgi:hypothetical protein
MLPDLLGLGLVAVIAATPFVSRRLRSSRVAQSAGAAAVSPVRHEPAGGMAVPEVQPRMTEPFAYSNGLVIGPADESRES